MQIRPRTPNLSHLDPRGTPQLLDDTYELQTKFDRCGTIEELDALVLDTVHPFGVESYLVGTMPPEGASPQEQLEHLILGSWPEEWVERYFALDYLHIDPAIQYVRSEIVPVEWTALRKRSKNALVMDEAREFSLSDGITIPQLTLDGVKVGASFAGGRMDNDNPRCRTVLTVCATYAIAAALRLARPDFEDYFEPLTERETEVLKWIAAGKTSWEIGKILDLAVPTVEKHLGGARRKLNTFTRAHTVAEALRRGVLQ